MKSNTSVPVVKSFFQKRLNKLSYNERKLLKLATEYHERNKILGLSMDGLVSEMFISPDRIKFLLNKLSSNNFITIKSDDNMIMSIALSDDYRDFIANQTQGLTHGN